MQVQTLKLTTSTSHPNVLKCSQMTDYLENSPTKLSTDEMFRGSCFKFCTENDDDTRRLDALFFILIQSCFKTT